MGGLSIENGAALQKLADYWELRKRNYSTRLASVPRNLRAGRARTVEEILTRKLIRTKVTVTSNSLAKRSSFRESSFMLTQANYRKLQRIVKQK